MEDKNGWQSELSSTRQVTHYKKTEYVNKAVLSIILDMQCEMVIFVYRLIFTCIPLANETCWPLGGCSFENILGFNSRYLKIDISFK